MDAFGWQIGAILVGVSSLVVAIYVAKVLNTTNKLAEKVNRTIDYNERYINETIENVSVIARDLRDILEIVSNVSSIFKIFKIFKK